jgi:hypothetical protein
VKSGFVHFERGKLEALGAGSMLAGLGIWCEDMIFEVCLR